MHIKFQEAQFFQNWTELSSEQARGLHSMCRPIRGNAPFILSGAPNTGKTRTVAFQIAYLLKIEVGVPFLVCAPDNNAIEKLMCALRDVLEEDVFNNQIIRLNNTETSPQTWLR
jgi:primosomal protein N'